MSGAAVIARNRSEQHAALLDAETPVHFGIGAAAGYLGISLTAAVLYDIAAEIVYHAAIEGPEQAVFRKLRPASSLGNHAVDVVATAIGYYIGKRFAP